jgi:ABC-type multidrug transport system fused ATPase/permease subunit
LRRSLVTDTARKHAGALVALIALEAIGAGVSVLTPLPLQAAIDSISGKSKLVSWLPASWTNSLLTLALASVGFAIIQQVINMASSIVATRSGQKVTVELRGQCFDAAQKRSIASHLTSGTADALYRIQTDTQALEWILLDGALPVLTATLSIIAMTAALLTLNLQLALVALVLGPILVVIGRTTRPALKSTARAAKQQESQALGIIESALSGLQTVKAYNLRSYTLGRYKKIAESAVARRIRIAWLDSSLGAAVQILCAIGLAGALYIGADAAAHGTLSPGQVILGIHYLGQIYTPIRVIGKKWASLQTQLVSLERIDFLLQTDTDVPVPNNPQAIPPTVQDISLTNVSFAYDEAHPILQDVSITIRKGDVIALTGPTGIGKSTLIALLLRLIDPVSGSVDINGIPATQLDPESLRGLYATVLQETVLFPGTIRENLLLAQPGASEEDIQAAIDAAALRSAINTFPDGLDTIVGERGAKLSGGERQRVGLARAFLRDAPILLLDEPTSALDPATEEGVLDALKRLMVGRTVVMVTHREAPTRLAGRVYRLEGGRLCEQNSSQMSNSAPTNDNAIQQIS